MQSNFSLIITADYPNRSADFRLLDKSGSQIAYKQTNFKSIPVSRQQGLFNLRSYVRNLVVEGEEGEATADIGVCIAEEVLGEEIFLKLWEATSQRSLCIQLPGAAKEGNILAAALARVPWEIARPSANHPTLGERNLLVRVVHDMKAPATQPLPLSKDECLRVLFVFAESRKSSPLALRLERQVLLHLFENRIYPQRRVIADFLTHGVTRERLEEQIRDRSGYHIVHWSGHGHLNLLELARPGGVSDHLTGQELLDLFNRAGGYIPHLFFLSACHSGDILRVEDWQDFLAVAQGKELGTKQHTSSKVKDIHIEVQPGYTGTAHALLQGGVPSVVAMRYAVGDEYARELAVEFYDALLAHKQPKSVASALTLARRSLLDPNRHNLSPYDACDHATPVLYGAEQVDLGLQKGRSPQLDIRNPRLHHIVELTSLGHQHFVGRTWELAGMGAEFIGSGRGEEVKPVAVITGLGGMGKTALIAEALSLWESKFEWILLYQAKPNALSFDATLSDIHLKLNGELGRYHEHVKSRPADAIYRSASAEFTGQERIDRLTRNLIRALKDEPILLVLDNFETNLKPRPQTDDGSEQAWAYHDVSWDQCLEMLAEGLVGTPSRVLITSRKPLAAPARNGCHRIVLGPLPASEAALYLREHAGLRKMVFSGDEAEQALARRLLTASRFQPLLMDRLARLATGGEGLRPKLMQALEALESRHTYSQLPNLFTKVPEGGKELAYLKSALAISLDQLIQDSSIEVRRLLWMIALANEPISLDLLMSAWSSEYLEQQQLQQVKQMIDTLPPDLRAEIDAMPLKAEVWPDLAPLLRQLVVIGMITEGRTGSEDNNPYFTCHELVRERILVWMDDHQEDQADLTADTIRLAYSERLSTSFFYLENKDMTAAIDVGIRAMVYCMQARAYERLGDFATGVVTSIRNLGILEGLLPHLESAIRSTPEGRSRWLCFATLADAFRLSGQPDTSLIYYEQAIVQARTAAEAKGENENLAWSDLGWITCNFANALCDIGELDGSRQRFLDSAEAAKRAGDPAIYTYAYEMEALRVSIYQGKTADVLPEIKAKLDQIEIWWLKHCSGQSVPEAPDSEALARAIISALDIARDAHFSQEDWEAALICIDTGLDVKRALKRPAEDIALTRVNRSSALANLGRYSEAQAEMEDCLQIFRNDPANRATVLGSLSLLFGDQGDLDQAITQQRRALAIREQLPYPKERAVSHNNLANFLNHRSRPFDLAEASRHQLAALIYRLVSVLKQDIQASLQNYTNDFRRANDSGTALIVARVGEILDDPAFVSLDEWLHQRQVDPVELQAEVDQFLERARQQALEQE